MSENTHDVDSLFQFAKSVVLEAGSQAISFYGKGKTGLRFDQDLVTQTENHLIRFFEKQLHNNFPDHQLFQNDLEDNNYTHDEKRYLWVFDPLDGSANFQSGIPIWGMSVALIENFWPIFGVFHMPSTGEMFHARAGGKAFRGNEIIQTPEYESLNDESLLFTYSRFHQRYRCSFPGKIRDLGCTGAHFCYVAMGRGDAAVAAKESFQDLAALRVILEAAGGKIRRLDGREFFLNEYLNGLSINESLLACAPDSCDRIKECLKEA